jgi:hypothetical protein
MKLRVLNKLDQPAHQPFSASSEGKDLQGNRKHEEDELESSGTSRSMDVPPTKAYTSAAGPTSRSLYELAQSDS